MNQRFDGPVDQVAAGDIHNYSNSTPMGRLLTKPERNDLNLTVKQLEAAGGDPGWVTWRFLHRVTGVDGVENMCIGHRDIANELLALLLQRTELQKAVDQQPLLQSEVQAAVENDVQAEIQRLSIAMRKSKREADNLSHRMKEETRRYDDVCTQLGQVKWLAEKQEKLLADSHAQIFKLNDQITHAKKRINRWKTGFMLLSGIILAAAASTYVILDNNLLRASGDDTKAITDVPVTKKGARR